MVLILTISGDLDTQLTIDWLRYWNRPFLRLNDDDLMNGKVLFEYNINQPEMAYFIDGEKKIFLNEISSVWYRKFGFLSEYEEDETEVKGYVKSEFISVAKLILSLLKPLKWLNHVENNPTKIKQLREALKLGISIPETIVTTSKKSLVSFKKDNLNIITKALYEPKQIFEDNNYYALFTLSINDLDNIPKTFSPSLIQSQIEKEYELRSFYLEGKFWTMAIFSQENPKTKLDFRYYDKEKPNRTVPYKLSEQLELQLRILMDRLNITTGSIDLIKSTDGKYIFLEVNPSGQFGMTSFPCNYNLHKQVAQYLTS